MNQVTTTAIVLSRTDFGEADRILTLLTPDHGKLHLMAKGVRRVKSKLAGGIELFSVSHITFIPGRGSIGTLVSTRLIKYYGLIVTNHARVQLGYELIKLLHKVTEDNSEPVYFELLEHTFQALDDLSIDTALIQVWFYAQLIRFGGNTPNLHTDAKGNKLLPVATYRFNFDSMSFTADSQGTFTAAHIKFLRLMFSGNQPKVLQHVYGNAELIASIRPMIQAMLNTFVRI